MTLKQQRLGLVLGGLACLGFAVALMTYALRDNIVFFHDPTEVLEGKLKIGQSARIGGLVVDGSITRFDDTRIEFMVTDTQSEIKVSYDGLLPDLFREGQGVVANGKLISPTEFEASQILAKHDENYIPKEVADALKEKGQWKNPGSTSSDQTSGTISTQ